MYSFYRKILFDELSQMSMMSQNPNFYVFGHVLMFWIVEFFHLKNK
jgi:hypothetical protein